MSRTYTMRGSASTGNSPLVEQIGTAREILKTEISQAVRFDTTRADSGESIDITVKDDDLVELEFDNGIRIWQRADTLEGDYPESSVRTAETGGFPVPREIRSKRKSRGVTSWILQGLKIINVDPVGAAATETARKLAERIEDKLQASEGLYRLEADRTLIEAGDLPADSEYLVFIHGTASSTMGSFSGLFSENPAVFTALQKKYGNRILAFEHRTLSRSPLENAVALASALPEGARVDLVTHSRGGLIGEILARCSRADVKDTAYFDDHDTAIFEARAKKGEISSDNKAAFGKYIEGEIAAMRQLNTLFSSRRIGVGRFVRVGCPAGGTTLASGRLDRYFSIIVNALGYLPGLKDNPAYELAVAFLVALAKMRTDPTELPGLEAQMPESALIACLNRQDLVLESELYAITGDAVGDGLLGRLVVFVSDLYYPDEHDLVVDTAAMRAGSARKNVAVELYNNLPDTCHFTYFTSGRSANAISVALDGQASAIGFVELASVGPSGRPGTRGWGRPESIEEQISSIKPDKPVVVLLPGIAGSNLRGNHGRIWLSLLATGLGELTKLDLEKGNKNVIPGSPIGLYYNGIVRHLEGSNNVIEFSYDWRKSMEEEARRLTATLDLILRKTGQPVRLLAHSMGGLVALLMYQSHPATWRELSRRAGFRLVMLGTPIGGAHAMAAFLTGRDKLVRQLALVDPLHDTDDLLGFISRFPGVLELLPATDKHRFFDLDTWKELRAAKGETWPLPREEDLVKALRVRKMLDGLKFDKSTMLYVAGEAPQTPVDIQVVDGGKGIRILSTTKGDGRVPWETGIPGELDCWLADAAHGDLPRKQKNFTAISELLETGRTSLLPDFSASANRGGAVVFDRYEEEEVRCFPDEQALEMSVLGATQDERKATEAPIDVRVYYGNMAFSPYPILIGHYEKTPFAGPEQYLDKCTHGLLRKHFNLDIYPGEKGTSLVLRNEKFSPSGVIVAGLGEFGELTPSSLRETLAKAIMNYCLQVCMVEMPGSGMTTIRLSTLLVGNRSGRINLQDSFIAILEAAREANALLANKARVTEVRVYELFEDKAIQLGRISANLRERAEFSEHFRIAPKVINTEGGLITNALFDDGEWSQRIQIKSKSESNGSTGKRTRRIEFITHEESARAYETSIAPQLSIINTYLEAAQYARGRSDKLGQLIFEQFVPLTTKLAISEASSLILLVDEETAAYPWELMVESNGGGLEPVSCRVAMVRQLITAPSVYQKRPDQSQRILVVGDPVSDFEELEYAQKEADIVSGLFAKRGYDPVTLVLDSGHRVLAEILTETNRVLHLAGHGIHDFDAADESGASSSAMVLGKDLYLTPDMVSNMSHCPEFVFLNCCHLGARHLTEPPRDETPAERRQRERVTSHRTEIASSLALQFIKSGAKAVIAAGWAIDDDGAMLFAHTFYEEMLKGTAFGRAAQAAREKVFNAYGTSSTYGAYQCYGDPQFSFVKGAQKWPERKGRPFASAYEAMIELHNIVANAAVTSFYTTDELRSRFKAVCERIPPHWLDHESGILGRMGDVERVFGEYPTAIKHYDSALACENTDVPIRLIEKRANLKAKNAVHQHDKGHMTLTEARETIKSVIAELGKLDELLGNGSGQAPGLSDAIAPADDVQQSVGNAQEHADWDFNSDRQSLIGSCYKCLARLATTKSQMLAQLEKMQAHYTRGFNTASKRKDNRAMIYSGLNRLYCLALLGKSSDAAFGRLERTIATVTQIQEEENPNFWTRIVPGDLAMIHLVSCNAQEIEAIRTEVVSIVDAAWRRGGDWRAATVVLDQISFLRTAIGVLKVDQYDKRAAALDGIRDYVERLAGRIVPNS